MQKYDILTQHLLPPRCVLINILQEAVCGSTTHIHIGHTQPLGTLVIKVIYRKVKERETK